MPAARINGQPDTYANATTRDLIGLTDPEVCKEALQQLTWKGVDPKLIQEALRERETIVKAVPLSPYDIDY